MDIFQLISIISFVLSSYLTLNKIFQAKSHINIDTYASYTVHDMIYIQAVIANHSSEPAMLINLNLSSSQTDEVWSATPFKKLIVSSVKGDRKLYSQALPINIPPKTASSFYLAFEVGTNNVSHIMEKDANLKFNLNGSYFDQIVNLKKVQSPIERLSRELD